MTPPLIDDPVTLYRHEVCKAEPLSPTEESELCREIRAQNDRSEHARARLVEASLGMVVDIAERHRNDGPVHVLDLIQEGNIPLMRASEAFDSKASASFSSFAALYIEQAILSAIANASSGSMKE